MRNYQTAYEWRKRHGHCRALLLETPYGHKILLKKDEPTPVGKFALLGVIE